MNKTEVKGKLKDNKLPEGWKITNLADANYFKIIGSGIEFFKGNKNYLSTNSIQRTKITHIEESITYFNRPSRANIQPKENRIAFAKMRNSMKVLYINKKLEKDYILSTGFSLFEVKIYPKYFYQYVMSRFFNRQKDLLAEGTTQEAISNDDFEKIYISFSFSLSEQCKIAEILETVDETIEKTDVIIEKYKRIKQGLMQDLLTRGIDENGQIRSEETHKFKDSPLGRIPEEWEAVEIKKIAEQVHLKNITNFNLPVLSCTKYNGLVDSLEYFKKQIFSDDISKYKIVKRRQFAYATNHLEEGAIGYQDIYNLAVISPMYTVFESNKNYINDNFLFRVLKTEKYRLVYESKTEASVNRRGGLRWKYFSDIKIPVPSFPEQQRIALILSQIDETIEKEKNYKEKLERIKQGLMEDLLTGKVRVNHLIKEGAESV